MKKGENSPILYLLKSLLAAYILTALFLSVLAFLVYKAGLTEKVVSIIIIAIYVLATFFAGFLTGKRMKNRRFLWGLLMGGGYFVVLAILSLIVNKTTAQLGGSFVTTLILCCGGGMLGGMMS